MKPEDTVIDLGTAADLTKGPPGTIFMEDILMRDAPGLSDD